MFTTNSPNSIKPLLIAALVSSILSAPVMSNAAPAAAVAPSQSIDLNRSAQHPEGFASLVETVQAAVVAISVDKSGDQVLPDFSSERKLPDMRMFDDFVQRFFDQYGYRLQMPDMAFAVSGNGSGFIIDENGYIVTNAHLVNKADHITVTLQDGSEHPATFIGQDEDTQLALVKIDSAKKLPYVTFADSPSLNPGERALILSKPSPFSNSAIATMITQASDSQNSPFADYLQLDTPMGHANVGSPVFNEQGQVIGVSTMPGWSHHGFATSYAIPATLAKNTLQQLRDHGSVQHAWLGVQIQPVTAKIAESLGLQSTQGALVADVMQDSPAAKAGIRSGDVILNFADKPINTAEELSQRVAAMHSQENTTVEIWRNGHKQTLTTRLSGQPERTMARSGGNNGINEMSGNDAAAQGKLGLTLAPLNERARQYLGLSDDAQGVVIVDVRGNSPAEREGLRAGDLITMVGQNTVVAPSDVVNAVKQANSDNHDSVMLLIKRGDNTRFVTVDLA
jgi:serine protease Do